jgi:citrate lyase subunit beta/citryl-CoA lyase
MPEIGAVFRAERDSQDMTRRSVLFTPGDQPEMLRSAPDSGADVLVFDLEDAVAPGQKEQARTTVVDVLDDDEFDPDAECCVRVNPIDAGANLDVEALGDAAETTDSIMLPKTASSSEIRRLASHCREHGLSPTVLALIESAAGVLAAPEIAASRATDALVFGAEDLAADLGARRTPEGDEVRYAQQRVVLAASAHGVDAVDTVYTDFEDTDGLASAVARAIEYGYDGKMAIHPAQVQPINDGFTPDQDRIDWATRVLDARADAEEADRGVFRVDGEMIDAPLITQARQIVERARASGRLDEAGD